MKHQWRLAFALSLLWGCADASEPLCNLSGGAPGKRAERATFVIVGTAQHGYSVISPRCANAPLVKLFSLGRSPRAEAFYRRVAHRPSRGFWEIQADVQWSGMDLRLERVHGYRELSEKETSALKLATFSPSETTEIERAAERAAQEAASARR